MSDAPGQVAWDEQLASPEEIEAARTAQPTAEEREAVLALVRWFTRRYRTYGERTQYIRRKWHEAQQLRRAGVPR